MPDNISIRGFMTWLGLGNPPLASEGDLQPAWAILATLKEPKKQIGIHDASNYLSQVIATLPMKGLDNVIDHYRAVKERLLNDNKLTEDEGKQIDTLIKKGLVQNKKMHEQYPNRP
jgi:hypothetical protein